MNCFLAHCMSLNNCFRLKKKKPFVSLLILWVNGYSEYGNKKVEWDLITSSTHSMFELNLN